MLSSLARLPTKEIITFSEDDYFLATEERSCKEECEEKDSFCALGQVLLMSVQKLIIILTYFLRNYRFNPLQVRYPLAEPSLILLATSGHNTSDLEKVRPLRVEAAHIKQITIGTRS